jgi:hypothetical protein
LSSVLRAHSRTSRRNYSSRDYSSRTSSSASAYQRSQITDSLLVPRRCFKGIAKRTGGSQPIQVMLVGPDLSGEGRGANDPSLSVLMTLLISMMLLLLVVPGVTIQWLSKKSNKSQEAQEDPFQR